MVLKEIKGKKGKRLKLEIKIGSLQKEEDALS